MSFNSDRNSDLERTKFVCRICNELFEDPEDLNDHLRTSHPENYNRQNSASHINNIAMDLTSSLKKLREIEGDFVNKIESINSLIAQYARENLSLTNDYRDALKKADKLKSENEDRLRDLEYEKASHQQEVYNFQHAIESYRASNKELENNLTNLAAERNELKKENEGMNEHINDLTVKITTLANFIYQRYRRRIDKDMVESLSGKRYETFETQPYGIRSIVIYDCAPYIKENLNRWISHGVWQIVNSYISENKIASSYPSYNLPLTTAKLLKKLVGSGAWIEQDRIIVDLPREFEI